MTITYLDSINKALHQAFDLNPAVHLLGEDLLDPYGGAFKVTKGLSTRFPDRVLGTPISEAAILGIANGLALRGMRPVVEIMFGDFLTLCADQIINHGTKFHAMYKGQVNVPVVLRTPVGAGRGYGPTHSQSLEKLFLGVPHLTVVSPSLAHDPGQLLLQAILEDEGVVLFIEHKLLYPLPIAPDGNDDDAHSLHIETIEESGGYPTVLVTTDPDTSPDVTVIAYGGMSRVCIDIMKSLAKEEVYVLLVLPSMLKPLPVDTLVSAAARTRRVVVAEEGAATFNWGSEVAAILSERLWTTLDRPVYRIAASDTIIPASTHLEKQVIVTPDKLETAILEVLT